MRQPAEKKRPDHLYLCDYCKNNVVVFNVRPLTNEWEQKKCFCCGRKRECRIFELVPRWDA